MKLLALALAACLLIGVAGCGPQADGDPQLTVYASVPLSGPRADQGRDVLAGAELALADAGSEGGGVAVELESVDDAIAKGWDAAATGANARSATEDSTAIAYIGELDSGASRTSIPITNGAGLLQVSPGSGAEDLTRDALGSSDVPNVQPSGSRTFGRVIPSDRAQGEAAAGWMSSRGIASARFAGDGSDFAAALQAGFESAPAAPALIAAGDAVFDARSDPLDPPGGKPLAAGKPLFGSDALLGNGEPGYTAKAVALGTCRAGEVGSGACSAPGALDVRLTSAALDPSQLPPAADAFLVDFRSSEGRPPGRYAVYGYEAMAVVLDSLERAEDPLDRGAVIEAFFATDDRDSVLGRYSIDAVGNTTLSELGAYELMGGSSRVEPTRDPLKLP